MLAFGFGSGLSPKAPGTIGSLAAIPLWLVLCQLPVVLYWLVVLVATLLGVYICGRAATKLGVHDHSGIVWDEFVGLWIAMAFLTPSLNTVICGFVLFRFFDIVKPWPIGWLDKKMQGGMGIMIDDIVAGIFAAGIAAYISYLGYL
ncbi:MAG: phosphatidylglycerophosphatase A [Porticoccaceae bacterium]